MKIVATFVCASSQGQRTHSARTNKGFKRSIYFPSLAKYFSFCVYVMAGVVLVHSLWRKLVPSTKYVLVNSVHQHSHTVLNRFIYFVTEGEGYY